MANREARLTPNAAHRSTSAGREVEIDDTIPPPWLCPKRWGTGFDAARSSTTQEAEAQARSASDEIAYQQREGQNPGGEDHTPGDVPPFAPRDLPG